MGREKYTNGQAIIEFTFCMIVIMIMIYGIIEVLRWTGEDIAERRITHQDVLTDAALTPTQQVEPDFYLPTDLDAIYRD